MNPQTSANIKESLPTNGKDNSPPLNPTDESRRQVRKTETQLEKASTKMPWASTPAPRHEDGVAWLQVIGSFFLWFNTWGLVNTFGVYQTYYQLDLLSSSTPSEISWIGSLQVFLLMVLPPSYPSYLVQSQSSDASLFTVWGIRHRSYI